MKSNADQSIEYKFKDSSKPLDAIDCARIIERDRLDEDVKSGKVEDPLTLDLNIVHPRYDNLYPLLRSLLTINIKRWKKKLRELLQIHYTTASNND